MVHQARNLVSKPGNLWYTGLVGEQYKRTPNTKCFVCGNPVYRRPLELEKSGGRAFCSVVCYGLSCRKENACLVCGNPILASLNKKTCSRKCANIYRTGIKYKLGRPSKDKVKNARFVKTGLLDIRGGKCERCGFSKTKILEVHHRDRNPSNNSLENLELICPNCHAEEHFG